MNTFVLHCPYAPKGRSYRVATYVKARNCEASQFKGLSGLLPFAEACRLAKLYASFPNAAFAQEVTQ
jgi:hypothetical protein